MGKQLFSISEEEYGNEYKNHLLDQYKLYVGSAEKISDRRQSANNYFIAINTAIITILGMSLKIDFLENLFWIRALLPIIGIIICIIFGFLIRSYKQLNSGKFKVIHKIEEKLPLALYDYEWEALGEGKNKKLYFPFTHIEIYIPWVFGFIYFVLCGIFILN